MTPRILSLCTGYGGLDLAVEAVTGAHTAAVADLDEGASHILAHRYPHAPNLGDLTSIDWSAWAGVDVMTAGYPCQPFSHAGKREGTNDERHLFPHIAAGIGVVRPRLVVLENVRGHLSLGFDAVLGTLSDLGYDARWTVVRASDVGAPHQRARLFIVAAPRDASSFGVEGADDQGRQGASGLVSEGLSSWSSPRPHADPEDLGHERPRQPRAGRARPANNSQAPTDPDELRLDEFGRVDAGSRDPHGRHMRQETFGIYAEAVARWEAALGRPAPDPNEPAPKGGRRLSARFVEWMMGLREGWVTGVPGLSWRDQVHALGNGVCPQQAAHALELLLDHEEARVA